MIRSVCLSKIVLRYFFLIAVILLFLSGCTAGRKAGSDEVVNEDMVPYMPKVTMPVLLIWGKNDTATPLSDGQKMESLVPIFLIFLKPSFVWDAYVLGIQRKDELVAALKKYKFFEEK